VKIIYEDHPSSIQLLIKFEALSQDEKKSSMNLPFFIDLKNIPSILDELS
jgi:hypothetical protein